MKHIRNINEAISGAISTDELYVVKSYIDTDIMTVYTSKSRAQKECDRANRNVYDELKKNFNNLKNFGGPYDTFEDFAKRNAPEYKVKTLYDAIDEVIEVTRENIQDEFYSHDNPGY